MGSTCLGIVFGITLADRWVPWDDPNHLIVWTLIGGLGVSLALMVLSGLSTRGRRRWVTFSLVALLMLGFAVLTLFSIGILVAPFGLALLGVSLRKLFRSTPPSD